MKELKSVFVCKECGMTHFTIERPRRCANCKRQLGKVLKMEVFEC